MDAYVVELARKNEVNSALNTKLDSSAFRGYYPSNNPSGFAKTTDVLMQSGVNLFDGRVVGINNQYLMGCDSAYNHTFVGTSAATGSQTASAYVGTGHQGINIQISARNNDIHYINWTAFSENGSNLSAGQLEFYSTPNNKISGFEINPPLAETVSGIKLYGNGTGFTAYSAYTIDVKPLASQNDITFLSGAVDYVSANAGDEFPASANEAIQYVQTNSANIDETVGCVQTNSASWGVGGYNETVIFNGDVSGQITDFNTNEQINNFEKLDVYYCCNDDGFSLLGGNITTYDTNVLTAQNQISLGGSYTISNGFTCFYNLYYTITNGSAFSCTQSKRFWMGPTDANPGAGAVKYNPTKDTEKKKNGYIYKIVGINRKA